MSKTTFSVNELCGKPVFDCARNGKRIGKVHTCIFHPSRRLVVGFTVKRPDVAWMFRRSDLFVAYDAFQVEGKKVFVQDDEATTGKAACKRLGVSWDDCIIWQGLPLVTEENEKLGHVGDVEFDAQTGEVVSLSVDQGATRNALLGMSHLTADQIQGFKFGVGDNLDLASDGEFTQGALIISNDALEAEKLGGLAEKAGEASAVAAFKAGEAAKVAKPKINEATQKAKEVAADAKESASTAAEQAAIAWRERPSGEEMTERASGALEDGALKLGRQIGKARGMFAGFKQNYKQALTEGNHTEAKGKDE